MPALIAITAGAALPLDCHLRDGDGRVFSPLL
jgi:hypothetical protein